jgi:FkbM family methyltransferase
VKINKSDFLNKIELLKNDKGIRIATFGFDESQLSVCDNAIFNGERIIANFDNDRSKWGKTNRIGVTTLPPSEIEQFLHKNNCFLVVMASDFLSISIQLDNMGINDYCWYWDSFDNSILIERTKIMLNLVKANKDKIRAVRDLCSDETSKIVLDNILAAKLSDDMAERVALIEKIYSGEPYFPSNIPFFKLSQDENFVDAGAFEGDTIKSFLETVNNQFSNIYAFEPEPCNFARLFDFAKTLPNTHLYNKGLYSHSAALEFVSDLGVGSAITNENNALRFKEFKNKTTISIDVAALDEIINSPVSFIKMDIEGAELNALSGAKNIIKLNKPKLAICLYHNPCDLWDIPLFVHDLVPDYNLYLRHHARGVMCNDTVLYAVI